MNHKLYFFVLFLALMPACTFARELVVTLKDGTRAAFHLSEDNKQTANVILTDEAVVINGISYARSNFKEIRIYKELPEGVDMADFIGEVGQSDNLQSDKAEVYDLSGRRIVNSKLQRGIYVVNKKVVVKK